MATWALFISFHPHRQALSFSADPEVAKEAFPRPRQQAGGRVEEKERRGERRQGRPAVTGHHCRRLSAATPPWITYVFFLAAASSS